MDMKHTFNLYNTKSRSLEQFNSLLPGKVGLYACGPTVYNYAHIGNMRTYVMEDTLVRILRGLDYEVNHVMNITDVGHLESDADDGEDKMEKAAKSQQKSPWEIAAYYTEAFFKHCDLLNIVKPDTVCPATGHIKEMIEMISTLITKGHAYESGGNVYFDVASYPQYAEFGKLDLSKQQSTSRVEFDRNKKNQYDFALWFSLSKYPNQIMKWESPWGEGFPGWHIECSAMARKYLGEYFDIHCGGIDHIPVHHTNEIAQSCCANDGDFVNCWVHGAFLQIDNDKMSKSSGNFFTVDTLIETGIPPLAYRYFVLNAHYRNEVNLTKKSLNKAVTSYLSLLERVQRWKELPGTSEIDQDMDADFKNRFLQALLDDMHTPNALQVLWSVVRSSDIGDRQKLALLLEFDKFLGLGFTETSRGQLSEHEECLINERESARKEKDWGTADALRQELFMAGISLQDTPDGCSWVRTK